MKEFTAVTLSNLIEIFHRNYPKMVPGALIFKGQAEEVLFKGMVVALEVSKAAIKASLKMTIVVQKIREKTILVGLNTMEEP